MQGCPTERRVSPALCYEMMKKVLIIGCPGGGKSTFARALHQRTALPLYYMDRLFWREDKTHLEREEFFHRIREVIRKDAWILDGNYSSSLELRLEACDTVFFLDYDLQTCLDGIARRKGTQRPDMPWIEDGEDPEFLQYVQDFAAQQVPQIRELLKHYPQKTIYIFHTRGESEAWLKKAMRNLPCVHYPEREECNEDMQKDY